MATKETTHQGDCICQEGKGSRESSEDMVTERQPQHGEGEPAQPVHRQPEEFIVEFLL
jgi:hypothetical protein